MLIYFRIIAPSTYVGRGIAREGGADPKKLSHHLMVLLLFFLVVGDSNKMR